MKEKTFLLYIAFLLFMALPSTLYSQPIPIMSVSDGNWTERSTWAGGNIPTVTNNVIIDHRVNLESNTLISVSVMNINVLVNGMLSISRRASLDVQDNLNINGGVVIQRGTGELVVMGNIDMNGGSLEFDMLVLGSDFSITPPAIVQGDNLELNSDGNLPSMIDKLETLILDAQLTLQNDLEVNNLNLRTNASRLTLGNNTLSIRGDISGSGDIAGGQTSGLRIVGSGDITSSVDNIIPDNLQDLHISRTDATISLTKSLVIYHTLILENASLSSRSVTFLRSSTSTLEPRMEIIGRGQYTGNQIGGTNYDLYYRMGSVEYSVGTEWGPSVRDVFISTETRFIINGDRAASRNVEISTGLGRSIISANTGSRLRIGSSRTGSLMSSQGVRSSVDFQNLDLNIAGDVTISDNFQSDFSGSVGVSAFYVNNLTVETRGSLFTALSLIITGDLDNQGTIGIRTTDSGVNIWMTLLGSIVGDGGSYVNPELLSIRFFQDVDFPSSLTRVKSLDVADKTTRLTNNLTVSDELFLTGNLNLNGQTLSVNEGYIRNSDIGSVSGVCYGGVISLNISSMVVQNYFFLGVEDGSSTRRATVSFQAGSLSAVGNNALDISVTSSPPAPTEELPLGSSGESVVSRRSNYLWTVENVVGIQRGRAILTFEVDEENIPPGTRLVLMRQEGMMWESISSQVPSFSSTRNERGRVLVSTRFEIDDASILETGLVLSLGIAFTGPLFQTLEANAITSSSAVLRGWVNPQGIQTFAVFHYRRQGDPNYISARVNPIEVITEQKGVAFNLEGLESSTNYEFRLSVEFDVSPGNSVTYNGNPLQFRTKESQPVITSLTSLNTGSTSTMVSFSIDWDGLDPTANPNAVILEYSRYDDFRIIDATGILPTRDANLGIYTADITRLVPSTNYYIRVVATNSNSVSSTSSLNITTEVVARISVLEVVDVGETAATLRASISTQASDLEVVFYYSKRRNIESPSSVVSLPVLASPSSPVNNFIVTALATDLDIGTRYYVRVETRLSTNSAERLSVSNNQNLLSAWVVKGQDDISFVTRVPPLVTSNFLNLEKEFSLWRIRERSSDYKQHEWRMIGFPGVESSKTFRELLGLDLSKQGRDWQIYAYDPTSLASPFFEHNDDDSRFSMRSPGKAFWVISKSRLIFNSTVEVPQVKGNSIEIPVRKGWNIITPPLAIVDDLDGLDWDVIKETNKITQPLWEYNGTWNQVSKMRIYQGYYYYHESDEIDILKIPISSLYRKSVIDSDDQVVTANDSKVEFKLEVDGYSDYLRFGISPYQKANSIPKPTPMNGGVSFSIYQPSNKKTTYLAEDIRSMSQLYNNDENSIMKWDVEVNVPKNKTAKIHLNYIYPLPEDLSIRVFNKITNEEITFNSQGEYFFESREGREILTILMGRSYDLEREVLSISKLDLKEDLLQNYPNPFSEQTIIEYKVYKEESVALQVYDVLGRVVTTLVDKNHQKKEGFHRVVYKPSRHLPSGLYFYRLIQGKKIQTKTMMFIR